MNILPLCRIFCPRHWQICEEQAGRMVSTNYLTVIGTWCENCNEVSSLEVSIFIDLCHTVWYEMTKRVNYWRCGCGQLTRRGWRHCPLFTMLWQEKTPLAEEESKWGELHSSSESVIPALHPGKTETLWNPSLHAQGCRSAAQVVADALRYRPWGENSFTIDLRKAEAFSKGDWYREPLREKSGEGCTDGKRS